jgi:hypothetical protein
MPGRERFVGRLGQRLAEEEEMREWEDARTARARERLLDDVGEEFEDSDDEEEGGQQGGGTGIARAVAVAGNGIGRPSQSTGREDQAPVVEAFERRLLELFLDGLDVSLISGLETDHADGRL